MPPTRRTATVPLVVTVLGAALAATLGLSACSGSSSGSTATVGNAAGVAGAQQDSGGAQDGSGMSAAAGSSAAAGVPEAAPPAAVARAASAGGGKAVAPAAGAGLPAPALKLVKTADLVVEVPVLRTAAAQVRSMAEGVGGAVASETTSYSSPVPAAVGAGTATPDGATPAPVRAPVQPGESVLVLRVPVAAMEQTVDRVASVGKELSRTSSSLDVTADLADLGSRVKTQTSSVTRVRELLAKASSLQDVVLLESELSRREAVREALQARQAALAGRADLSTLTVTLRTPDAAPPATTPRTEDNSFVGGLKKGWHAVIVSTGVVLTVLGALLPLLVILALVGLPVWWFWRRRTAGRRAPAGVAPSGPSGPSSSGPASGTSSAPSAPPAP